MTYSRATLYLFLCLFAAFVLWAINALLTTAETPVESGGHQEPIPPAFQTRGGGTEIIKTYIPEPDKPGSGASRTERGETGSVANESKEEDANLNEDAFLPSEDEPDLPTPLEEDAPPPPTGELPPENEGKPELAL